MKKQFLTALGLVSVLTAMPSQAANQDPAYASASREAAARYAEDKKLCGEEPNASARMQCLRDAKTVYNNAVAAAKQASANRAPVQQNGKQPVCADCGRVAQVTVSEREGEGSAIGVIAGGVAGALLGNQVGGGTGRDLATIAGAAGGAMAGHKIEQKVKSSKVWNVVVQYDNGNRRTFVFDHDPGFHNGDQVVNQGNSIVRR